MEDDEAERLGLEADSEEDEEDSESEVEVYEESDDDDEVFQVFFNFPYVLLSSQIIKISHCDSLKPQFTDGFSDNDLYAQNEVLQGQQFVALIFQFSK